MTLEQIFPDIQAQPRVRRARYICDTLRQMIREGQLSPGDRLPTEEELCKHFKVSRTTLREAVQMLRFSGLLKVSPGRGSFVQQPDIKNLLEDVALYSICLGEESAGQAAHISGVVLIESLRLMRHVPQQERRKLFDYILNRHDNAQEAQNREAEWQLAIAKLSSNSLMPTVLEMLLSIQAKERTQSFADSDEIMRTIQTQIRLNTAIVDGEWDIAERVLTMYVSAVPGVMVDTKKHA